MCNACAEQAMIDQSLLAVVGHNRSRRALWYVALALGVGLVGGGFVALFGEEAVAEAAESLFGDIERDEEPTPNGEPEPHEALRGRREDEDLVQEPKIVAEHSGPPKPEDVV